MWLRYRAKDGEEKSPSVEAALSAYRTALQDGLLRIMSKMGIATVDSYRGAQQVEILGLHDEVCHASYTS